MFICTYVFYKKKNQKFGRVWDRVRSFGCMLKSKSKYFTRVRVWNLQDPEVHVTFTSAMYKCCSVGLVSTPNYFFKSQFS